VTESACPPFVTRVQVVGYRSIAACDVTLGPLTVLVGPNAAGKSNFLDAIRFVADAVATSPEAAVAARGGMGSLLRRGIDIGTTLSLHNHHDERGA
jgi:predicted ATPase